MEQLKMDHGVDLMILVKVIIFVIIAGILVYFSRASLTNPKSHGFYRFFAWIDIAALIVINSDMWFANPLAINQVISWILLMISIVLVIEGISLLQTIGKPSQSRMDNSLLGMEKTTRLVVVGLYKYIRHPLYSSLLFLGWGVFFKSITIFSTILVILATTGLVLTARKEELENTAYFGDEYQEYMKKTRMFIPYIL